MSVHRHIEINSQRNVNGFVNLGDNHTIPNGNKIPEAKNALVFLAIGINGYWK